MDAAIGNNCDVERFPSVHAPQLHTLELMPLRDDLLDEAILTALRSPLLTSVTLGGARISATNVLQLAARLNEGLWPNLKIHL